MSLREQIGAHNHLGGFDKDCAECNPVDSERTASKRVCAEHCGHDPELTYKGICRHQATIMADICGHRCFSESELRHNFVRGDGGGLCYYELPDTDLQVCGRPRDDECHVPPGGE